MREDKVCVLGKGKEKEEDGKGKGGRERKGGREGAGRLAPHTIYFRPCYVISTNEHSVA